VSTGAGSTARVQPLTPPTEESMTPAQREAVATIVAGPRGALVGPFAPLLHSPELMTRVQKVGEHLRFSTELPDRLLETAILCVARHWDQPFEWGFHQPLALAAGVSQDDVDALGDGRRPADDELVAAVSDLAQALLRTGRRDEEAWERLAGELSSTAVLELVATLGYYTTLALVMNAADTEPSDGMPALPERSGR